MPEPAPRATVDGQVIPVERVGTDGRPLTPKTPVALLRAIEWRSFTAGFGIAAVGGVATWIGSWWWRQRRTKRRDV